MWIRPGTLWWVGVLGALAGGAGLTGCATRAVQERPAGGALESRYEFSKPEMGMPFRIVLYAPDGLAASNAAQAAFTRIGQLNLIFSDYEDDSELTLLSKSAGQGRAVPVSDDLWRVLTQARQMSKRSEGAFDVTVGPLVQLWRRARRQREFPAPERIVEAQAAVGWRKLKLEARRQTVELLAPGMRLDLGAIAKGYALEAALQVVRSHEIRRALVMSSGDMAAGDPPPGKKGWRIELGTLNSTNEAAEHVLLANAALATSGDTFQRVILNGVRYSHIVDPRTGIGLTDHSLVTVIAPDATTADALSTTVSVLGPVKGLKLVKSVRGAAARVLRQPAGQVERIESPGFGNWLEQGRGER